LKRVIFGQFGQFWGPAVRAPGETLQPEHVVLLCLIICGQQVAFELFRIAFRAWVGAAKPKNLQKMSKNVNVVLRVWL
jgi:hypothetical protein